MRGTAISCVLVALMAATSSAATLNQDGLIGQTDPSYLYFESEWFDRATNNQADNTWYLAQSNYLTNGVVVRSPSQASNATNPFDNQLIYRLLFTNPGDYTLYAFRTGQGGADSIFPAKDFGIRAPDPPNPASTNGIRWNGIPNNNWSELGVTPAVGNDQPGAAFYTSGVIGAYRVTQAQIDAGQPLELFIGAREFPADFDRFVLHTTKGLTAAALNALTPSASLVNSPAAVQADRFIYAQTPNGKWNRYEESERANTWVNAATDAHNRSFNGVSGQLASVHDARELVAVSGLVTQNSWIGLTDNEAFGGTENGNTSAMPAPSDGSEPVVGQRGAGFVYTSGEPFSFQRFNRTSTGGPQEPNDSGGEDALEVIPISANEPNRGRFNDLPHDNPTVFRNFVVEYPTQLDQKPALPIGLAPAPGNWAVREVRGAGVLNSVYQAEAALNSLDGTKFDYHSATINHWDPQNAGGGGNFGNNNTFASNTPNNDEDFLLYAKARVLITEEDDYTIGFRGDDGSWLRMPGNTFTSSTTIAHPAAIANNNSGNAFTTLANDATGQTGPAHVGDLLQYPNPTGNSQTLGVVHLTPGVHEVETLFFERGGGGHYEVFAARGAKTAVDGTFRPIGQRRAERHFYKPGMVPLPDGSGNNFTIEVADSAGTELEAGAGAHMVSTALAVLDNAANPHFVGAAPVVNHVDPGFGGGFANADLPWPGLDDGGVDNNNYATRSTGTLDMLADGWVRFHLQSDDGFRFFVDGAQFQIVTAANPSLTQVIAIANPGDAVQAQYGTGNTNTILEAFIPAGLHTLELIHWDGNGGGYAEVYVGGPGLATDPVASRMLLGSTAAMDLGIEVDEGLQLVPEPSTWALAGIALVALAFVRRRRSQ